MSERHETGHFISSGLPLEQPRLRVHNLDGSVTLVPASPLVEVAPGVDVSEHGIREAALSPVSGDMPKHLRDRDVALKEDIEVSRGVVASLVMRARGVTLDELGDQAKAVASSVVDLDVVRNRRAITDCVTSARPIVEHHIDELQAVMHVRKHVPADKLPDQVMFAVPNVDLPAPVASDPSDVVFELTRYVRIDTMPPELRSVVRTYLSLLRGSASFSSFRAMVDALHSKVAEVVDPIEALHAAPHVDGAPGCVDPRP